MEQWSIAIWLSAGSLVLAVGSLIWNLGNTIYTHSVQRKVRESSDKLAQFVIVRDPIFVALKGLDAQRKCILALQESGKSDADVRADLQPINRPLVDAFLELAESLEDADESRFASGQDWKACLGDAEDSALTTMNEALKPTCTRNDFDESIKMIDAALRQVSRRVKARIENEMADISNVKLGTGSAFRKSELSLRDILIW